MEYVIGTDIDADFAPSALSVDRPTTTLRAEVGSVDSERVAEYRETSLARCAAVESDAGFAALLDEWRGGLRAETSDGVVELTEGETSRVRTAE